MPDCDIYVEDGKIAKIWPHGMVPQGWKVEDMKGAYAAPGLVNMHVHLFGTGAPSKILAGGKAQTAVLKFVHTPLGKAVLGLLVQSAAKNQLYSGVTTLRAVGDFCNSDIALKRKTARGKGSARGLKMLVSEPAITVTGGHGAGTFAVYADDPKELEKLVDVNVGACADFIKICVTGGVMDAKRRGEPGELKMSAEQVKAVCDRAHAHGKIVAAHVESRQGVEVAALNGVDTIEHGALMSGEAVAAMKARKGAFVTTYSPPKPAVFGGFFRGTYSPLRRRSAAPAAEPVTRHTRRSARCEQARAPLPVLSEQSESCCLHQKSRGLRLGFLLSATVLRAAVPPHALRRNL